MQGITDKQQSKLYFGCYYTISAYICWKPELHSGSMLKF